MPNDQKNRVAKYISNFSPKDTKYKFYFDQVERATNSKYVTKAINKLDSAVQPESSNKYYKGLITSLLPPADLEQLPAADEKTAFDNLRSLPRFDRCEEQLNLLSNSIRFWQEAGVNLRGKCQKLHAVVFSENETVPTDFAKRYHVYLIAVGVLKQGDKLSQVDGSKHRSLWSLEALDSGLCIVKNAAELSLHGAKDLVKAMDAKKNIVFVASYVGKDERLHSSIEKDPFSFHLQLVDPKATKSPIQAVQELVETWVKDNISPRMKLDRDWDGLWATTFAKRILEKAGGEDNEKNIKTQLSRELALVSERQHARLLKAAKNGNEVDACLITKEDLLGEEPDVDSLDTEAFKELNSMAGLEQVKDAIRSYANAVLLDHHRATLGQKPARAGLNRLFLGPPGTGKTTVAKLYGQMLSNLGVLKPGGFVLKGAADFIGPYIGHSEKRTKKILAESKGKVLMIDEAYLLDPARGRGAAFKDPFRQAVVDTIVNEVQNTADDNRCVILAGYKDEMEHMLNNANPGLEGRFPMQNAFVFEEFGEMQLQQILHHKLEKEGYTVTDQSRKVAIDMLLLAKQRQGFANGREIDKLLGRALLSYQARFGNMTQEERNALGDTCFCPEDFDPDWDQSFRMGDKVRELFDELQGLAAVQSNLVSLSQKASTLREAGQDPAKFLPYYFVFQGPRGTGKTTIAKKMGWILHALRLIPSEDIIQRSAQDLIAPPGSVGAAPYLGEQSSQLAKIFEQALGKVLVLDEAHCLFGDASDYTNSRIAGVRQELTKTMNEPRFVKSVAVILIGSDVRLERMLDANPGLGSKFSLRMHFPGLTGKVCLSLIERKMQTRNVITSINIGEQSSIVDTFDILCRSTQWENHRDINLIANALTSDAIVEGATEGSLPVVSGSEILSHIQHRYSRQLAMSGRRDLRPETGVPPARTTSADIGTTPGENLVTEEKSKVAPAPAKTNIHPVLESDTSMTYEFRKLPDNDRSIRVLRLLPASDADQAIECVLEELSLSVPPGQRRTYHALSYVWGETGPTQRILCNGKILRVTRNCELALRYLRRRDSPLTLWIDALCINQEDVDERNAQVSIMGEIYRNAFHVYIWLAEGSHQEHLALRRLRKLRCLKGNWGENEELRKKLMEQYQSTAANFDVLKHFLRHEWWERMWTFQEFVLARRPVFVVGHTKIHWDDFYDVVFDVLRDSAKQEGGRKGKWLKAQKSAVIRHLVPAEFEDTPELELVVHLLPTWLEIVETFLCRAAYQDKLKLHIPLPVFMSYFLLKTRNRRSKDPRDKVYGLRYLFQVAGYEVPKVDYSQSIVQVYKEFADTLLQKSQSWWILSHLFNKRGTSNLSLASWVPDFSLPAVWHQGLDIRFATLNQLQHALLPSHGQELAHNLLPFSISNVEDKRVWTKAVFLWTVKKATFEMQTDPVLDRSLTENFEQTDFDVFSRALQGFLFSLAGWVKAIEPTEGEIDDGNFAVTANDSASSTGPEDQVIRGVAYAFYRASWNVIQSLGWLGEGIDSDDEDGDKLPSQKYPALLFNKDTIEQVPYEAESGTKERAELADSQAEGPASEEKTVLQRKEREASAREENAKTRDVILSIFYDIMKNSRACIYPDARHPCRHCGATDVAQHQGSDAVEHFMEWVKANHGNDGLEYMRYALYSRAVDHSLIQTNATDSCAGHFGFCRNQPFVADEIVMLPGLPDPVVVRRTERDPPIYRVVGVTTGMIVPSDEIQSHGEETQRFCFCFGTCGAMEDLSRREMRSFWLQ